MRKIEHKKLILRYVLVVLAIGLTLITGCGYTAEEKEKIEYIEKQGSINAVNYIKEKYGIDAKVKESFADKIDPSPIPDFSPAPSGLARVTMEYGGREFKVVIPGLEESLGGKDDYQYPEIMHMLSEYARNDIGVKVKGLYAYYSAANDEMYCIRGKINSVADLFIEENRVKLLIIASGDVDEKKLGAADYECLSALVVKCTDEKIEKDFIDNVNHNDLLYNMDYYYPGMDYFLVAGKDGWEYHKIIKGDIDTGISYCYDDKAVDNLLIKQSDDMYFEYAWEGHGFIEPERISDCYSLSFDAIGGGNGRPRVKIVYDNSIYRGRDTRIAEQYIKNGETKIESANTFDMGDYSITSVYSEEDYIFAIFNDKSSRAIR